MQEIGVSVERGEKYNLWEVIDTSLADRSNSYKILCRCDCGSEGFVSKKYLKKGSSKSCGCQGLYVGVAVGKSVIVEIIHEAKRRKFLLKCQHDILYQKRSGRELEMCPCDFLKNHSEIKTIHGEANEKTEEYRTWKGMRQRCNDPKNKAFKYYGGRGIKVCERWNSYSNFLQDMGRRPKGKMSIDRINSDGDYEPSNCRWADIFTQNKNRTFGRAYD